MKSSEINQAGKTPQYEPGNIIRIEAKSNYCKIHFTNGVATLVLSKVLHLVQANLPADMFVRVHRSHLINRQYIKQVSGTHVKIAELTNGEYIAFSRRKQAMLCKTDLQTISPFTMPNS